MKQKILSSIIFFAFTLFYSVLTMASPGTENKVVEEGHHTTISQDCKLPNDISADDFLASTSDFQVIINRHHIPALEKTVHSSKFNNHGDVNHYFRDQVCVKITQYTVSNPHSSILFTGVLII